jgi:hypothetical protein
MDVDGQRIVAVRELGQFGFAFIGRQRVRAAAAGAPPTGCLGPLLHPLDGISPHTRECAVDPRAGEGRAMPALYSRRPDFYAPSCLAIVTRLSTIPDR